MSGPNSLSEGLLQAARAATEPSPAEIACLRAAARAPSRSFAPRLAFAAVALASLLFLVSRGGPLEYGPSPEAGAEVTLDGSLTLGPSIALTGVASLVVRRAGPEGTALSLTSGSLRARVDPDGPFRALSVATPDGTTVSVVGTVFAVAWDGARGEVVVERGAVAVDGPDGARQVRAGETYSWTGGVEVGEGSRPDPIDSLTEDGGAPDLPDPGDRPPPPSKQPAAAPRSAAPAPPAPEPVALLEPAPEPSPDLARARAFGRIQEALDAGRPADAALLAERFAGKWPDGPLASEAGILRIEALASADPAGAAALSARWLSAHPQHPRRLDVLRVRATLARDALHDCALALPAYEELARDDLGADQARALAYLGLCAEDVGEADRSVTALTRALAHPSLPPALAPRLRAALDRLREDPR